MWVLGCGHHGGGGGSTRCSCADVTAGAEDLGQAGLCITGHQALCHSHEAGVGAYISVMGWPQRSTTRWRA